VHKADYTCSVTSQLSPRVYAALRCMMIPCFFIPSRSACYLHRKAAPDSAEAANPRLTFITVLYRGKGLWDLRLLQNSYASNKSPSEPIRSHSFSIPASYNYVTFPYFRGSESIVLITRSQASVMLQTNVNPLRPTPASTFNSCSFCIYGYCMSLTVNSGYFLKQR
jgi:hypothetical protein